MKKGHLKFILLQVSILLVLGGLVIIAIALPELTAMRPKQLPLEISVLIRENDSAVWTNTRLGMEQAAYNLGAELRFLTPVRNNSEEEQHTLLSREILGGSDAVLIAPAAPDVLTALMSEAETNIPIISMESYADAASAYVMPDNDDIGTMLSQALESDFPDGGTILLLDTGGSSPGVQIRTEVTRDYLEAKGFTAVLCTFGSGISGMELILLNSTYTPNAVMTFDPTTTQRAIEDLDRMDSPPPLYGVGSTNHIAAALERGVISATVTWNEYASGYLAVQKAVDLIQSRVTASSILDVSLIRGGDIYKPENQKLLFPVTG